MYWLAHAVARGDVADFVAQDGGQLGLGIEHRQHAAGDVDVAAGQGEGVDLLAVEHGEAVNQILTVASGGEPLSHLLDVALESRVLIAPVLFQNLIVGLASDGELLGLVHENEVASARDRILGAGEKRGGAEQDGEVTFDGIHSGHFTGGDPRASPETAVIGTRPPR